jgi:hypothetical protein
MLPFPQFEARLREMLAAGQTLEIINLIEDQGGYYPAEHLHLKYWQIGMAARERNTDLAIAYLDELLEEGLWISPYLLRTSPSFENLQDSPDFEARLEAMAALQRAEQAQLLPLLTLRAEGSAPPAGYPVLIGLHAARATSLASLQFWQPAARAGWLVGAPQSSQALWSGAYVWEDADLAQRETADSLRLLARQYPLDTRRRAIAGHREGGELAAWLAISGGFDAAGFIAIAPAGPRTLRPDDWFRTAQARPPAPLRGVFLASQPSPELKRLASLLTALGIPARLQTLPSPGGAYTPACDAALLAALDFIFQNDPQG